MKKKVIGYYRTLMMFPDTYGKIKCYGRRPIPQRLVKRSTAAVHEGLLKGCCQVLVKSIGTGYQWININNHEFTAA